MDKKTFRRILATMASTMKFANKCIDNAFNIFKKECEYRVSGRNYPACCINKDNTTLIEIVGGGYFECSIDSCPLINE